MVSFSLKPLLLLKNYRQNKNTLTVSLAGTLKIIPTVNLPKAIAKVVVTKAF